MYLLISYADILQSLQFLIKSWCSFVISTLFCLVYTRDSFLRSTRATDRLVDRESILELLDTTSVAFELLLKVNILFAWTSLLLIVGLDLKLNFPFGWNFCSVAFKSLLNLSISYIFIYNFKKKTKKSKKKVKKPKKEKT